MGEFSKYLEGVKAKLGIESDLQLSKRIGVSYSLTHGFLHAEKIPGDDICLRIAKLAGDDPMQVLLLARKGKATDASKPYWEKLFKAVAAAALSLFLTLSLFSPALASQPDRITELANNIHYRTRRFFRWLSELFTSKSCDDCPSCKYQDVSLFLSCRRAVLTLLVVLIPVLPSSSFAAAADPHAWTKTDTALELTYQTLRYIDWKQTLYIGQHPKEYGEANPVLDGNMTHGNINRYMGFLAVTHVAVSAILPKPYRTIWQAITIIEVGNAVQNNRKLGLAINLHF